MKTKKLLLFLIDCIKYYNYLIMSFYKDNLNFIFSHKIKK